MFVLSYFLKAIHNSFIILCLGLLPWVVVGFLLHYVSLVLREKMVRLLGVDVYIYATAPGVVIHELSHAFFCLIFSHRISDMKIFSPREDGTLGYVNHLYNPSSRFQRIGNVFIGTGPVWGGLLILWLMTRFLLPEEFLANQAGFCRVLFHCFHSLFSIEFWRHGLSWVWLYLVLAVSSHITLSKSDLVGALDGFCALVTSIFLFEVLFGWWDFGNFFIQFSLIDFFVRISCVLGVFLFFNIVLIVFLSFLPQRKVL